MNLITLAAGAVALGVSGAIATGALPNPMLLTSSLSASVAAVPENEDGSIDTALEAFSRISVATGADVTVVPGDIFRLKADAKAVKKLDFKVKGETLIIRKRRMSMGGLEGKIEVTTPGFDEIEASTGADLLVEKGFEPVEFLNLEASTGAMLDVRQLTAKEVRADASTGAELVLTVTERMNADASTGAFIHYSGNPTSVTVDTSTGGEVSRDLGSTDD